MLLPPLATTRDTRPCGLQNQCHCNLKRKVSILAEVAVLLLLIEIQSQSHQNHWRTWACFCWQRTDPWPLSLVGLCSEYTELIRKVGCLRLFGSHFFVVFLLLENIQMMMSGVRCSRQESYFVVQLNKPTWFFWQTYQVPSRTQGFGKQLVWRFPEVSRSNAGGGRYTSHQNLRYLRGVSKMFWTSLKTWVRDCRVECRYPLRVPFRQSSKVLSENHFCRFGGAK